VEGKGGGKKKGKEKGGSLILFLPIIDDKRGGLKKAADRTSPLSSTTMVLRTERKARKEGEREID